MSANFNRKIGSPVVSLLQFEADEWSAINFDETPVRGKITQGDVEVEAVVGLDYDTLTATVSVDTYAFAVGQAQFDVWIGESPIPVGYNIKINLFKGVVE